MNQKNFDHTPDMMAQKGVKSRKNYASATTKLCFPTDIALCEHALTGPAANSQVLRLHDDEHHLKNVAVHALTL